MIIFFPMYASEEHWNRTPWRTGVQKDPKCMNFGFECFLMHILEKKILRIPDITKVWMLLQTNRNMVDWQSQKVRVYKQISSLFGFWKDRLGSQKTPVGQAWIKENSHRHSHTYSLSLSLSLSLSHSLIHTNTHI